MKRSIGFLAVAFVLLCASGPLICQEEVDELFNPADWDELFPLDEEEKPEKETEVIEDTELPEDTEIIDDTELPEDTEVVDEFELPDETEAVDDFKFPGDTVKKVRPDLSTEGMGSKFGLNIDYYMPMDHKYVGNVGIGFCYNFSLSVESMIDLSANFFSITNEHNDTMKGTIYTLKGGYLRFFGGMYVGGGAGVGMATYSAFDESSQFAFGEIKTGYAINDGNRISLRYLVPLNTEDKTNTISFGYEIFF